MTHSLRKTAISAAKKAGELLKKQHGKPVPGIKKKEGGSLVTSLDVECNDIILAEINRAFPSHNIITEESAGQDNKSEFTWYVDPIDGTHNYIRGLPLYGVSIGVARKGAMECGVMYFPSFDELFVAEKGKGAHKNGKKLRSSSHGAIEYASIICDGGYHGRKNKLGFIASIARKHFDDRSFGCAIYTLALAAEGKSDAFVMFATNSWDVAAGFLIVEEAGGKITALDGKPWSFSDGRYVGGSPALVKNLIPFVRAYR